MNFNFSLRTSLLKKQWTTALQMNLWTAAFHCCHYKGDVKKKTAFFSRPAYLMRQCLITHSLIDCRWNWNVHWHRFFYNRSSKFAIKRLDAVSYWSNMVHWAFNIITCICYTCVCSGIFIHVLIVGATKFISSVSSVICNRPVSLKLAWTVPWVVKLLDSFHWRTRNIKHVLSRTRSTAQRLTQILREILERFLTTDLLDSTILGPACKAAQDFQSWFTKMQCRKRNQMGWSR